MLKKLIVFCVLIIAGVPASAYKVQTYTPVQTLPPYYGYGPVMNPMMMPYTRKHFRRPRRIVPVSPVVCPQLTRTIVPPLLPSAGAASYLPSQTNIQRTTTIHPTETRIPSIAPLQPAQNESTVFQPETEQNSIAASYSSAENYPKITALENTIFHKTYENQDIYARLKRLEKKLFRRTFDNMALSDRMDNILNNVDPAIVYNINQKELAKIENKILGRSFEYESIDERITRLEKEMLGAMQGGNIKQRYEVVKSAARHYNAFPAYTAGGTPQNNYTMYNNYRKPRRNILSFIFDMMSTGFGAGAMTGYTPPVFSPFDNFQDASGIQDYYMGNRGGYYNNRNMGNGSTVKILD